MYPKNIKLILAISTLIYSIYQFYENNIGNGIALILLVIIFVFLYFKNEIILIIFFKLRKQDFDGTEKWLKKIKNPERSLTKKASWLLQLFMGNCVFSNKPYQS